jgi:cell division transport system permease protein
MSGSFSRPPRAGAKPTADYEPYDPYAGDLPSAPLMDDPPTLRPDGGLRAPDRGQIAEKPKGTAPIVPAGSVTSRALNLVIVIMCFLACLTAGAVYMMNQSASAWLRDIASEVTVQIEPREKVDTDRTVKDVTAFLATQPGIASVRPMSADFGAKLLEPWLGSSEGLKALPVPRLIAVEVNRQAPPDLNLMRNALSRQFQGVSLDDHRQWQKQIRTVTRSFALGGIAILILVGAATTAIIITATRSAIASNREIVEVLHFVGATDRFIAREFEKQFLTLGVRAGLVGAMSAMAVFLALPTVMDVLGEGTMTLGEINRLIGSGSLDLAGYALLVLVVVVIAALCMLTSRISVFRILHSKH